VSYLFSYLPSVLSLYHVTQVQSHCCICPWSKVRVSFLRKLISHVFFCDVSDRVFHFSSSDLINSRCAHNNAVKNIYWWILTSVHQSNPTTTTTGDISSPDFPCSPQPLDISFICSAILFQWISTGVTFACLVFLVQCDNHGFHVSLDACYCRNAAVCFLALVVSSVHCTILAHHCVFHHLSSCWWSPELSSV
jgi:hypothetical protein